MDCTKMLLSITEFNCFIHQMLWNTKAETAEYYELIYELI